MQVALREDAQSLSADRLAEIDGHGVQTLFGWPSPVPLQAKRAALLREVGGPHGNQPHARPKTLLNAFKSLLPVMSMACLYTDQHEGVRATSQRERQRWQVIQQIWTATCQSTGNVQA